MFTLVFFIWIVVNIIALLIMAVSGTDSYSDIRVEIERHGNISLARTLTICILLLAFLINFFLWWFFRKIVKGIEFLCEVRIDAGTLRAAKLRLLSIPRPRFRLPFRR